jgi:hypothetical protein
MPELGRHSRDADLVDAYLLLGGCDAAKVEGDAFPALLRRMGLSPAPADDAALAGLFDDPAWTIRIAESSTITGRAASSVVAAATADDVTISTAGAVDFGTPGTTATLLCHPRWRDGVDRVAASRELLKITVLLADAMAATTIFWSPAGLWSEAQTFRQAIAEMLSSGMPPLMHLLAFDHRPDGVTITRGLRFFAGQELQLLPGSGLDRRESIRRLARLALDIMIHGAITGPRSFPGLVDGERIRVGPATGADGAAVLIVTVIWS